MYHTVTGVEIDERTQSYWLFFRHIINSKVWHRHNVSTGQHFNHLRVIEVERTIGKTAAFGYMVLQNRGKQCRWNGGAGINSRTKKVIKCSVVWCEYSVVIFTTQKLDEQVV